MIAADFMFPLSDAPPRQPLGSGYLDLRPLYRHGLALLILALALALRLAVLPPGYGLAFLTLYPATLLSCYLCGAGAGGATIVLGAIAGYMIQSTSFEQLNFDGKAVLATLLFVLLSGFMVLLLYRLQAIAAELRATLSPTNSRSPSTFKSWKRNPTSFSNSIPATPSLTSTRRFATCLA